MIVIPKISDLYNDIKADMYARLGITVSDNMKLFIPVICAVQAAKLKLFYLAVASLQKNIFVDTADPEASGGTLERFGRVKLGRDPFPPRAAQYTISVTGVSGSSIPQNTTWKSDDDSLHPGVIYIIDYDYETVSSTDFVTVRCLTGGTAGQLLESDTMSLTSPISGVDKKASVDSVFVSPVDAESSEEYRSKVLLSYRLEPQGGAPTDYRIWALDAQGVKNVYAYARSGYTSEVNLFVESTAADGIAPIDLLNDVESVVDFNPDTTLSLNERGRRPAGVKVNYISITPLSISIDINGYQDLDDTKKDLVNNQLNSIVSKIRPFVSGADVLSEKNDTLDTNKIISSILTATPGATFGAITLQVNSIEENSHTFTDGDIPYYDLNTSLTWS